VEIRKDEAHVEKQKFLIDEAGQLIRILSAIIQKVSRP